MISEEENERMIEQLDKFLALIEEQGRKLDRLEAVVQKLEEKHDAEEHSDQ